MSRISPAASLPYFHRFNSYDEIRLAFLPYLQQDGYFLVRNSMSGDQYCISVVHDKQVKHLRIDEIDGTYILQEQTFRSLDELVRYYRDHEIPNDEKILHVKLKYPITQKKKLRVIAQRCRSAGEVLNTSKGRSPVRTISVPDHMANRPPAVLPREAMTANVEAPSPDTKPPGFCYDYAKITNHIEEVKQNVRRMDLEDAGELCQCGLSIADSKLPMGWTVHRSTEPGTTGRVFFVSPSQHSAWDLPAEVDAQLSNEQRFFIMGLKQQISQ